MNLFGKEGLALLLWVGLMLFGVTVTGGAAQVPAVLNKGLGLEFDSTRKEYTAKPGETETLFVFNLTNVSPKEVIIRKVTTSCGCTVAKLPSQPWVLKPDAHGHLDVVMDFRGKRGTLVKGVMIHADTGLKNLQIVAKLPEATPPSSGRIMNRTKNIQKAVADPTAIFKGDCASCHVKPALGKIGRPLYDAACGICHDAEHRASMVPDLRALNHPTNAEHWRHWIVSGREGSMMPGFAKANGGPLTERQVDSLVDYLTDAIPSRRPPGLGNPSTPIQLQSPGTRAVIPQK